MADGIVVIQFLSVAFTIYKSNYTEYEIEQQIGPNIPKRFITKNANLKHLLKFKVDKDIRFRK